MEDILINADIVKSIKAIGEYQVDPAFAPGRRAPVKLPGCPVIFWVHDTRNVGGGLSVAENPYCESTRANQLCHGFVQEARALPTAPQPIFVPFLQPRKDIRDIVQGILALGYQKTPDGQTRIDMQSILQIMRPCHEEHLEFSRSAKRAVLRATSELDLRATEFHMPKLLMEWLGGYNSEPILRIPSSLLRDKYVQNFGQPQW
ncbi:hypothetical protein P280DRAFT_515287 [Massarina eburnea CBS 473.64]|uniref:Uncharacterized protein n=1 Tax=Massarina eburnea CBS 473.64 TaxID=1395130 RepID=A0A6A6S9T1_9PLEO|nr:hypothetical protein P280DRAFT_515287 [Massarina eburnea CBS 473.64]